MGIMIRKNNLLSPIARVNKEKINFSMFDRQTSNFNPLSLINEPIYSIPYDNTYHPSKNKHSIY